MPEEPHGDTFLTHLEALRGTVFQCLAALAVAFPFCYFASPRVIDLLIGYCCPPELGVLHYFSPMEAFVAELKLSLVLAAAVTWPWSAWRIWRFLLPALYPEERRAFRFWILFSGILFFAGAAFGAGVILPLVMKFSAGFARDGLQPMIGLGSFLGLAGVMTLAAGLVFQTPVVVLLLVRFGLVEPASLRKSRPVVIVILLTAAAILTPPDVISQLLLFFPMWFLFELGLFLSGFLRNHGKRSGGAEESEGGEDGGDPTMENFYSDQRNK